MIDILFHYVAFLSLIHISTSFMQPRDDKGIFIKDFKADDYTPHICESNGWQYFWSVQHDINGPVSYTHLIVLVPKSTTN